MRKHGRRYYEEQRYYHSKWVTFSAAAVLMLSAGLPYSFSVYGSALQAALGYSQRQIAGIGTAANLGGYAALFAGLFYDWAKRYKRYGPRMCAAIGATLYSVGFSGMYAAAKGYIPAPYWLVVIFTIAANNGGCWLESAALVTTLQNFETERGAIVGLLKSFLGLSASIYTTIYVTFLAPDGLAFLLLLSWLPSLITLICVCGVNHVPFIEVEPHAKSHAFHLTLVAILSLATYQLVSALFFAHETYKHGGPPDQDVVRLRCFPLAR